MSPRKRARARLQVRSPVANPFTCKCQLDAGTCPCHRSSAECTRTASVRRRDLNGDWADLCRECAKTHATLRQDGGIIPSGRPPCTDGTERWLTDDDVADGDDP